MSPSVLLTTYPLMWVDCSYSMPYIRDMGKTASMGADMKVNGWAYDPAQQAWTAKVGPNRWLIIKGDLDDAPRFRPQTIA